MSRSSGSLCSQEAKSFAEELATLTGMSYRQNLDYIRFIEQLMSFRICEQVRDYAFREDNSKPTAVVEIPLIGKLTIKPVIFHKAHRLTDKPSLHFEFIFTPMSGFKKHILDAYTLGECTLPTEFANMYGDTLADIYTEG